MKSPSRLLRRLLFLAVASGLVVHAADKPSILWLTSEDHGQHMGCYGDPLARTPHVDALAAKGMIFRHAWSNNPVCAPARTTIISGIDSASSGGQHMRSMVAMPAGKKMYPQFLREAGYYCTNNSKEDYNLRKPAGVWDDSSTTGHWRNRPAGQPFFAIFNSTKSHESQIRKQPHTVITDPSKVRVPSYHPDTSEVRRDWAQYYDIVSEVDADAGALLAELAADGLAADTIVFYYGDHGSGMPRSKRWPCNSGLEVPIVVYFPPKWQHLAPKEYRPGGKSDRLVSFVDLAPTLLSLAGVRPPEWMQGFAFAGKYQSDFQPYLFGSRGRMDERMDCVRSVTDGRYVYLRNFYPQVSQAQHVDYQFQTPTTRIWRELYDQGKATDAQSIFWRTPKAPEELYDLQGDPDEVRNLANSPAHRATLEKLRSVVHAHAALTRDVCFLPEGELQSRSQGSSPYDIARDESKYPFERIYAAADLASRLEPAALPQLHTLLRDSDSAVRYWAALGFLMRGQAGVENGQADLRGALGDKSPYVRIVAAQALAQYGPASDLQPALAVLAELAPPARNGVLVTMPALSAIEELGPKAASLHELVRTMSPTGPSPDGRYNGYVLQLIQNIAPKPAGTAPAKGKGKGKRKAAAKSEL